MKLSLGPNHLPLLSTLPTILSQKYSKSIRNRDRLNQKQILHTKSKSFRQ